MSEIINGKEKSSKRSAEDGVGLEIGAEHDIKRSRLVDNDNNAGSNNATTFVESTSTSTSTSMFRPSAANPTPEGSTNRNSEVEMQRTVIDEDDVSNAGDGKEPAVVEDNQSEVSNSTTGNGNSRGNLILSEDRWRAHNISEDYVNLAANMMFSGGARMAPFGYDPSSGQYPIEAITALGMLTSPLRRPTVIEKWTPYEIAVFEASLALCGKQFHDVQKIVKTKNTKEIIEFYYVWKKTSHYKVWKRQYIPPEADVDSDDD